MQNIPKVRDYLFWDVDYQQMDWQTEDAAAWILRRVVERGGNEADFTALVDFYGLPLLQKIGRTLMDFRFPQNREILAKLLDLDLNEMLCYIEKRSRAERLLSLKH